MTDLRLRQFLLRRLPDDETAALEESIILEDGFAERLRDEEFDLLDDYAGSRLSAEDAAAVERHLLKSGESLHSLRIAYALQRQDAVHDEKPPQPDVAAPAIQQVQQPSEVALRSRSVVMPRWSTSRVAQGATLIAACLVAIAFIPHWLTGMRAPESAPPAPAKAASNAIRSSELHPGVAPEAGLPIITLVADVSRGEMRASPNIPAGATSIRLQAEVPGQAEDALYSIRIQDSRGQQLFEGTRLGVHTAGPYRFVEVVVPTAAVEPGDRTVSLTGSDAAPISPAKFVWHLNITAGLGHPK